MESIKDIIKGTTAYLSYVCEGKIYYTISTQKHKYQLEIDTMSDEWKATYAYPEFKAIKLMRWIRKGMENDKLIQLK